MSEKKNIERLFQEKFKDFEATPHEKVWENIASRLVKKESKKRVIPFWFQYKNIGIAASFILGIFIWNNYSKKPNEILDNNKIEKVVSTDKINSKIESEALEILGKEKTNYKKLESQKSENTFNEKNKKEENSIVLNDKIEKNKNKSNRVYSNLNKISTNTEIIKSDYLAISSKETIENKINLSDEEKEIAKSDNNTSNEFIVETINQENIEKALNQKTSIGSDKNISDKNVSESKNASKISIGNSKIQIAINRASKEEINKKDSLITTKIVENILEKLLKEKESKVTEETKKATILQRWKVKPNVAPLFLSASQGSPIDENFADNTKKFNNNLSVGLGIDYAISKRFTIRTGIHKFDFNYDTNDIVYYASIEKNNTARRNIIPVSSAIKTITFTKEAENMVIEDKKITPNPEIAFQTKDDGLLNQQTSYLEIPFEISYKLLDKKFGIQFITGFSSLFLNENKISVNSNNQTTVVGEANNLNKIHFSTNVGLGFKYSFWKSFEANLEPTFKYQINTYNTNSNGFKPYLIGLYTGISFKF